MSGLLGLEPRDHRVMLESHKGGVRRVNVADGDRNRRHCRAACGHDADLRAGAFTATLVPRVTPKSTVAPAANSVPVTMTVVPPVMGPALGAIPVMVGGMGRSQVR